MICFKNDFAPNGAHAVGFNRAGIVDHPCVQLIQTFGGQDDLTLWGFDGVTVADERGDGAGGGDDAH